MCIAAVIAALEVSPDLKARRAQLVRMAPIFLLLSGATWYWSTQLGLALAFETTPFRIELFGHFLYGITSVAFVLPFCLDEGTSRIVKIFGSKAFVWLGTISYGMYLWHFLFLGGDFANTYLPYRIGDMGIATRLLITIPGTIAVATVSYYLIERPLIRSLSRVLQKQKNQSQLT
jgi:peptidoglycan/LPS O-acetylase OafA/YrhL